MNRAADVLAFRGVEKSFGRLKVLTGIDLAVAAGEFVALVAPAGSGKTAILHLAIGLDAPDRGTVTFDGRDVARHPLAARAAIGAVFEASALEPERSVRANLRFAADLYGLQRQPAADRIAALLRRFGLAEHDRDLVRGLGAMNRRRVDIARAVLHRPKLLLLSSITEGLERSMRDDLVDEVRRLAADEGAAVLWATTQADEAQKADRLIVLHRGGIVFAGPPAELLSKTEQTSLGAAVAELSGSETGR